MFSQPEPGFDPWSGNWDSPSCTTQPKKKETPPKKQNKTCGNFRFFPVSTEDFDLWLADTKTTLWHLSFCRTSNCWLIVRLRVAIDAEVYSKKKQRWNQVKTQKLKKYICKSSHEEDDYMFVPKRWRRKPSSPGMKTLKNDVSGGKKP